MVLIAILGLAVSVAACGAAPVASKGTVTGYVEVFSPVAGLHRATSPFELTATHDGLRVARTYSTSNGDFRFRLPPGAYSIALTAVYGYQGGKAGWYSPGCHATKQVQISSDRVTKVSLTCGTARHSALGSA